MLFKPRLDGAAAAVVDVHGLLGVGLLDHNLSVAHLEGRTEQRFTMWTL